jgi:hypothetical protein
MFNDLLLVMPEAVISEDLFQNLLGRGNGSFHKLIPRAFGENTKACRAAKIFSTTC